MLLAAVAEVSAAVTATSARNGKVELLARFLRSSTSSQDSAVAVSWLTGALTQRQIGVGWAALRERPAPAVDATLTVIGVERLFTELGATSGSGSQARRRQLLTELFAAATTAEQDFLHRLLGGELRQGALAGVMSDALARAAAVPLADIRRAAMLGGDLPAVAAAALHGGSGALAAFRLEVGRPVGPMLAQPADGVDAALARLGGAPAWEWKLDGMRIQVHRRGGDVAIYTRTLDDITARLPEVVEAILALPADALLADGEAIALRPDGRPHPFQLTSSRLGGRRGVAAGRAATPITPYFFDVLHVDGTDLLDQPTSARLARLDALVPERNRVPRVVTGSVGKAQHFLADALARGHEGVMAKSMNAPYEAGRRGGSWLKVKPVHTLDLVVLAVEWGSGRRRGWLSNIHLGARDPAGGFVMLGKTFKGMTDQMLSYYTMRFLDLADGPTDGWVVRLRPEQVVEIAFDGVQRSSRYPGGLALRFARVVRYRDDKRPEEADTIEAVRALYIE